VNLRFAFRRLRTSWLMVGILKLISDNELKSIAVRAEFIPEFANSLCTFPENTASAVPQRIAKSIELHGTVNR